MTILGAQLEDLLSLSSRLTATSGDVGTVRGDAVESSNIVIATVSEAATRAVGAISSHMEVLSTSVGAAVAQADATQWTGANADRFREAARSFNQSIVAAQGATNDTFEQFNSQIQAMGESLERYTQELTRALTDAQTATDEMSNAVRAQHDNLNEVMNAGLTVS